jgi:hypothetical protein
MTGTDGGLPGLYYVVDRHGTILSVSADWDATARANGGAAATADRVVGTPVCRHIAGDAARMYLEAAIQAVRVSGRPRRLGYRCDSPTERRFMEMCLTPEPDGAVRVSHRQLRGEPRPPQPAALAALRRPLVCTICLRQTLAGDWQDAAEAPVAAPGQLYSVCPDCDAAARR